MKEETKASKEEQECKLKEKRKKSGDLVDTPFPYSNIPIELDLELFFGIMVVTRKIFVEPLFHENTEGCGDEGNGETQRPQSIDRHSESRTSGRRRGRDS